ncbi:hypothetical protein EKO04_009934 [Ascochyta lentis]|uniref:Protein kinase domain-containing protein n=1 Tax=Ascochyta lentis TaxID=205686 RepID=A0A8H7MEK5_9PLEO|nr:hypothetical protein EKO04_009934 [Ascochyta lentis]
MARDVESFQSLRGSLSRSLRQEAHIPVIIDERNVMTEKNEQRFFPAGTATKILTINKLERLFTQVTAADPTIELQPRWLAQKADRRELHVFLATLIISNCNLDVLESFTQKIVAQGTVGHSLWNLPIEGLVYLKNILGGDEVAADDFHRHQYDFLAPVIEKNNEIKGNFQRLPFLSEVLIGEGSFGKIYKVVISPNHFRFDSSSINDRELTLARKQFLLEADTHAHENERKVLLDIVRNSKKSINIMEGWGSLEFGSTFSLFMPLAICDLQQFMERNPSPPTLPKEKAVFVERAIGLAGAIVFLHEELESPVYEKFSCFHMDLKPQNILVVNDEVTEAIRF